MNTEGLTSAILKVRFNSYHPADSLLNELLESGLQSATLLRGRMTPSDAWYEVEITGTPELVAATLPGGHRGADRFSRLVHSVA
jgi:hypothetical protein